MWVKKIFQSKVHKSLWPYKLDDVGFFAKSLTSLFQLVSPFTPPPGPESMLLWVINFEKFGSQVVLQVIRVHNAQYNGDCGYKDSLDTANIGQKVCDRVASSLDDDEVGVLSHQNARHNVWI